MGDQKTHTGAELDSDRTALMSARALSPGYEILWYKIEDVLGQGGFGITYLAHDMNLDRQVAIKEYLPTTFAYRYVDYSVKPLTGDHRENYIWGLESFLKEAKTLAKFDHENIVRVHSVFESNSTAYMVMEYERGENLATLFDFRQEECDQKFYEGVFFPIFDGLSYIHESGFIHRDIKPANIYIRQNGTPVLIDFGSARQTSQQQTGEMTTLVSQGYTPLEQYSANYGDQGPWTDIYALAATLYKGVTGNRPDDSLSRSACRMRAKPDSINRLQESSNSGYSQVFLDAIHLGLALEPENRPQTLEDWLLEFNGHVKAKSYPSQTVNSDFADFEGFGTDEYDPASTNLPASLVPESSTSTQSLYGRKGERMAIDGLDFDVADSYSESPEDEYHNLSGRPRSDLRRSIEAETTKQSNKIKRFRMLPVVGALAFVISIGGFYAWYSAQSKLPVIDSSLLSTLPSPSTAVPVILPKELVFKQLDDIALLATFYHKALAVKPDDEETLSGIERLYDDLRDMATNWNSERHNDLTNRILFVSSRLPENSEKRSEIRELISSAGQRSSADKIFQMLESNRIFAPTGESVIDSVTSLSKEDYKTVSSNKNWLKIISRLRSEAVEKIKQSDFDEAAKLVSAVLIFQPDDAQTISIRDHLALR